MVLGPLEIEFKKTMFQSAGDLLMYHGMIVCGLLVLFIATKELVKEIMEYVRYRFGREKS